MIRPIYIRAFVRGLNNDKANCNLHTLNFVKSIDVSADDHPSDNFVWVSSLCPSPKPSLGSMMCSMSVILLLIKNYHFAQQKK